jgi:DNA-binding NtrC family response regulator
MPAFSAAVTAPGCLSLRGLTAPAECLHARMPVAYMQNLRVQVEVDEVGGDAGGIQLDARDPGEAARLLGIGRNTITRKIQELGLDAADD